MKLFYCECGGLLEVDKELQVEAVEDNIMVVRAKCKDCKDDKFLHLELKEVE